ncbi:MAG: rhamnulokinase, partial [Prevotella sp.]|nr:rhamnulokinase [Prevotella sp.]
MDKSKCFFAVDLGATSGRTVVGTIADGKVEIEEITRFANNLIETGGHFYWDIYALYFEIIRGLKVVAKRGIDITSIGIDTWGVDFVCIGDDGALLRNPLAYRDPHTFGAMEEYFNNVVPKEEVYKITG